ncbi:MAG: DUF1905 domain-containing protein [Acidimicrobiia bacterium]
MTQFRAVCWQHVGPDAWYFVTLPLGLAEEIRAEREHKPFGSVPVRVTIGATTWTTSVFADKQSGSYLLPVKAEVRRKERIDDGDEVTVVLVAR